jgi:hypothetical protein
MAKYVTSSGNPSEKWKAQAWMENIKVDLNKNGGYMDKINFIIP